MSRYKSNHDCFGNPTLVPGGALQEDNGPALVAQMKERLANEAAESGGRQHTLSQDCWCRPVVEKVDRS